MTSAAEILPFPNFADGHGSRAPRGVEAEHVALFVDPADAERVMAEGQPGDELTAFLRRSIGKLGRTESPQARETPHPAVAPTSAFHARQEAALPPEHPAYEAPRPAPVDMSPPHQRGYGADAYGALPGFELHTPYPVQPPASAIPFPGPLPSPPPHRQAPPVAGAPEGGTMPFDIPSFLRARPSIPQPAPVSAPPPAPTHPSAAAPASPVLPTPRALAGPARSPGSLASVASELLWVYSVFPVILIFQVLGGIAWEPLASIAATFAFLIFAAAGASVRPALFQLRVAAGWQMVATVSVFRGLDTASPEQWMHMSAAFAATAVVAAAMGSIEIHSCLRGR